jgi:hypothetical protein
MPKKSTEAPFSVNVPDKLKDVFSSKGIAADFRTAADEDMPYV